MVGAAQPAPGRRAAPAVLLVLLSALLGGLLVVGRAPFAPDHVHFAVDTASAHAPWSAGAPRNPELSDQGVAFYPHYRELARRWSAGEFPSWNPRVYLGVPEAANPQWGAYDPQVAALGALEAAGGRAWFDRGFAWLAWLRVALALSGAWCLARALGLRGAAAALVAVGYGFSAAQVLWLHYPHGHVAPFLPWVLVGIERVAAGARQGAGAGGGAVSGAALAFVAMLLAILGGQPETACFVGLAAGLWCLVATRGAARARIVGLGALAAATLCAGPLLVPFVEYLAHSGALVAHRAASSAAAAPDWVALGAMLIAVGVVARLAQTTVGRGSATPWLAALVAGGLAYALAQRGLDDRAALAWWPDRFGRPQDPGGYGGAESFLETASAWLPLPVLALAIAGWFARATPTARPVGGDVAGTKAGAARAGFVALVGAAALALAWEAPGVAELWRRVPGLGLAAPNRVAPVAALFLSLGAGHALERAPAWSRRAAVLTTLVCAALASVGGGARPLPAGAVPLDARTELVEYAELPPARVAGGAVRFAGALHAGVPARSAELAIVPLDARGRERVENAQVMPLELARDARGWSAFDSGPLEVARLDEGQYLFTLRVFADAGEDVGEWGGARTATIERRVATTLVARERGVTLTSLLALLGTAVLVWRSARGGTALVGGLLVALAAAQGAWFARGWNPLVPRAEAFAPTRTADVLRDVLGDRRLLAGPGVYPTNTPLVDGLATLGGYDALDPATFNGYRAAALRPGAHPVLDWDARGVDPASPAFRLLGVGALVTAEPLAPRGWTIVAGPRALGAGTSDGDALRDAEAFVAVPDAPLPTAFCVPRLVPRDEALARAADLDPQLEAFVEPAHHRELAAPFTNYRVTRLESRDELERYRVALDGDALFLRLAQHFPGWEVTVDGEARELLRANSLFRAVLLEAGDHEVVFRYAPRSRSWGIGAFACGALAFALVVLVANRNSRVTAARA